MKKGSKLFLSLLALMALTPIGEASFVVNNNEVTTKDVTIAKSHGAVCYNKQTGVKYTTLNQACDMASSGQSIYTIPDLGFSIDIERDLNIRNGVSLYVPYSSTLNNGTYTNEVFDAGDNFLRTSPASYVDCNASNVRTNRKALINLSSNVSINIASGATLALGGSFGTNGVNSSYCEIKMANNSQIVCNGNFYCFGYIKQLASNGNGALTMNSGSVIKTPICIYDLPGSGSTLQSHVDNNICPLNIFDFRNLQCHLRLNYGSKFIAIARFFKSIAKQDVLANKEVVISDTVSNTGSVLFKFKTNDSYLTMDYVTPDSEFTNNPNDKNRYHNFHFNGQFEVGSFKIVVDNLPVINNITIDTSLYFMPLSYKLKLYLDNAVLHSSFKIKLMPGAYLNIGQNSNFDLNSDLIIYDNHTLVDEYGYPHSAGDARLINNGTLTISKASHIGGFVETEDNNGGALIDLRNANESNLVCSSIEGKTLVKYTKEMTGYHYNDNNLKICQFKVSKIVHSSINASTPSWARNDTWATFAVNISVKETNFAINIFSYDIYNATSSSGTNEVSLLNNAQNPTYSFHIREDKFYKINVKRHNSVNVISGSFTNNAYCAAGDATIEIVPNEGVTLKIQTFHGNSGAGTVKNTIQESFPDKNHFVQIHNGNFGGEVKINLIKNAWFKVLTDTGAAIGGYKDYETIQIGGVFSSDPAVHQTYPKFKAGTAYQATDNVFIYRSGAGFDTGGGGCFAKGTLILMGDGTYKKVENIKTTDLVMAFNHITGKLEPTKLLVKVDHGITKYDYMNLYFDNGESLTFIDKHEAFDYTLMKYQEFNVDNISTLVGHEFVSFKDGIMNKTKLVSYDTGKYNDDSYTLVSYQNLNIIANSILTFTSDLIGLTNYFEYNDDLSFNKEAMKRDIALYGLYTYDDWKHIASYQMFDGFNMKYFKVAIGKGLVSYDEIVGYVYYANELLNNGEMEYGK